MYWYFRSSFLTSSPIKLHGCLEVWFGGKWRFVHTWVKVVKWDILWCIRNSQRLWTTWICCNGIKNSSNMPYLCICTINSNSVWGFHYIYFNVLFKNRSCCEYVKCSANISYKGSNILFHLNFYNGTYLLVILFCGFNDYNKDLILTSFLVFLNLNVFLLPAFARWSLLLIWSDAPPIASLLPPEWRMLLTPPESESTTSIKEFVSS